MVGERATQARQTPVPDEGSARLVWLGALLMLASLALPWTELRPNRLAPGAYLGVGALGWPLAALALALAALARRALAATLLGNLALLMAFVGLGRVTALALIGQDDVARASASTGPWLWLLGAGVAWWGASFALRLRAPRLGVWAWPWLPAAVAFALLGGLSGWSVWREGGVEQGRLLQEALQHVRLTFTALGLALLIGAPLAVWASRSARVAALVLSVAGGVQTLPSLALLGLLIAPLAALADRFPTLREYGVSGIGVAPALVALTLYALLPVLRNGVVALVDVDPAALDAARGMGMTDVQRFFRVQLPLALPVWLAGVRQATVLLIGVTAVAALIGAGGLGVYIFRGLNSSATDLILLGAIPASLLALAADGLWRLIEWLLGRRLGRVRP